MNAFVVCPQCKSSLRLEHEPGVPVVRCYWKSGDAVVTTDSVVTSRVVNCPKCFWVVSIASVEWTSPVPAGQSTPFDPVAISTLVKLVAGKILRIGYQLSHWTRDAVSEHGEGIRPHIASIWDKALAHAYEAAAPKSHVELTLQPHATSETDQKRRDTRPVFAQVTQISPSPEPPVFGDKVTPIPPSTGPDIPAVPTAEVGWRVIHAGLELGPFSLGELVENAVVGKIEGDDLVKQSGGLWTKAREVPYLQGHFFFTESKNQTVPDGAATSSVQRSQPFVIPVPVTAPLPVAEIAPPVVPPNVPVSEWPRDFVEKARAYYASNKNWLIPAAIVISAVLVVWFVWHMVSRDLTGTTWRGEEVLPGFGPLTFEFQKNNVAIMTDAKSRVKGTWSRSGDFVSIRFHNCDYTGTIRGNTIAGTASYFGVPGVWHFVVRR